jgi:hypothetical protein
MSAELADQTTVPHPTKCKFCHLPITLEIDSGYAELGDPLKLLQFACCNRCADLRTDKRRLTAALVSLANEIALIKRSDDLALTVARERLVRVTQAYCGLVADWHNHPFTKWDEQLVTAIMENPKGLGPIIGRLWRA